MMNLFDNEIPSTTIRRDLCGRTVLYTSEPDVMNAKTVGQILETLLPVHFQNAAQIDYLHNYYKGSQPIIDRKKEIRPSIKNIIIENRAFEIVEFKKGYEFSHPIVYTLASEREGTRIDSLNKFARLDSKDSKDIDLSEWLYKSGNGYRLTLPAENPTEDDAPYYTVTLDPRNTFVIYSNDVTQKKLMAGVIVKRTTALKTTFSCGVYTENEYYLWENMDEQLGAYSKYEPKVTKNTLGIPIVEYMLNQARIGYVELALSLFDAINNLDSNRIDAIEQFVQSILLFVNCDYEDAPESGDIVAVHGKVGLPADVRFIGDQLDQSHTQVTKEDLLNAIYEICGVPDRKTRGNGGGDTGQAVVLRDGWGAAEARAKTTEKSFVRSENEYLKLVLKICRVVAKEDVGDLKLADIDIKFTRNRSDNMQTKAQTLSTLLAAGVHPSIAFDYCEMFGDPVLAYTMSKAILEQKLNSEAATDKTADNENNEPGDTPDDKEEPQDEE